ncbi:MAG TPA: GNAT family N-acetyltransferase [Galbitalea sp.]|jgi:ElaA protein
MPDCSAVDRAWGELTSDDLYAFLKLRTDVFFLEQNITETELDDRDNEPDTRHYWISDDQGAAAYLRTLRDADPAHRDAHRLIGRVVVRADRRGEGLSQQLLTEAIARHGSEAMLLHAQEYIAPLYARFGFEPFGEVYEEAGIPHLSMYRPADA